MDGENVFVTVSEYDSKNPVDAHMSRFRNRTYRPDGSIININEDTL